MSEEKGQEAQEVQETEVEVQAREFGWKPKEEFDAEEKNKGKKWRDAETFMELKPLYDKIDTSHQRVRTLERGLKALAEHNAKIEKASYEKALKELQAQKKAAVEENDVVRVEELRDQIEEIRTAQQQVKAPEVVPPEPPQELVEWKGKNPWYQTDETMTLYADALGNRLASQGYAPNQVLQEVQRKVREEFPQKFRNPNKDTAPEQVNGDSRGRGIPRASNMPEADRRIMEGILRTGIMTKEEYLKQYNALK